MAAGGDKRAIYERFIDPAAEENINIDGKLQGYRAGTGTRVPVARVTTVSDRCRP
ncbi:MAG: hypothetical protein U1F43_21880 [Myxococcota bacterium]